MKLLNKKDKCCGCTACLNICPKNAIVMKEDEEGFKYPQIDLSLCVNCGTCEKVCPLTAERTPDEMRQPNVYGAKIKDFSIRMESTSGGMFSALIRNIINKGGIVYGASFDKNMNVIHTRAENIPESEVFKGSKYVQSDLSDIFVQIEKDLKKNLFVLFSGTPCQCDGLRRYLELKKINCDKLILCDIVCHGVPSPKIWRDYVKNLEHNRKIINYKFRDKNSGWHGANIRVDYDDGTSEINTLTVKSYTNIYFNNYITRPCCEKCPYANFDRCSDITIGDFWGIEKANPEFDDNKGVSLILLNTLKGEMIFNEVKDGLEYFISNTKDCMQEQLKQPPKTNVKRRAFWRTYNARGFIYVAKKYGRCGFYGYVRHHIIRLLISHNILKK